MSRCHADRRADGQTLSFASPLLKNDRDWTATASAVMVELKPSKRKHEDILVTMVPFTAPSIKANADYGPVNQSQCGLADLSTRR